jgi:hypothetical protein
MTRKCSIHTIKIYVCLSLVASALRAAATMTVRCGCGRRRRRRRRWRDGDGDGDFVRQSSSRGESPGVAISQPFLAG